jgi:AraC-like DNA-binding protein
MSTSRFQQLFKKEAGTSPMAYLRTQRLERACKPLSDARCFLQIKEIAYQVGIPNEGQFTREFRKLTGNSPTEFRKICAEIEQAKHEIVPK